jgi:hypothetical protein
MHALHHTTLPACAYRQAHRPANKSNTTRVGAVNKANTTCHVLNTAHQQSGQAGHCHGIASAVTVQHPVTSSRHHHITAADPQPVQDATQPVTSADEPDLDSTAA